MQTSIGGSAASSGDVIARLLGGGITQRLGDQRGDVDIEADDPIRTRGIGLDVRRTTFRIAAICSFVCR